MIVGRIPRGTEMSDTINEVRAKKLLNTLAQNVYIDFVKALARMTIKEFVQNEDKTPDMYCFTLPDGSCVSKDPRCMHNK